jgi:hypothetical protein
MAKASFEVYQQETPLPLAFLIFLLPVQLYAQLPTGISNVSLSATVTESLSISVGVGSVTFNVTPGATAVGSSTVPITTSWVLKPSRSAVHVIGYFDTTNALTNTDPGPPASYITVSQVFGKVNGGSRNPFTGAAVGGIGVGGTTLELFSQTITGANKVDTRNDTLDLEIDADAQQAAGDYTGTLHIQAVAL